MTCREMRRELVECARAGTAPGIELTRHLAACGDCSRRWTLECELTAGLGTIRSAVMSRRIPAPAHRLLAEAFMRRRRRSVLRRRLAWTLTAAAALVLVLAGRDGWEYWKRYTAGSAVTLQAEAAGQPGIDGNYVSIPYALPLSSEELVSVVRVDLPPSAFVRMGFAPIDTAAAIITADVVVGEDGLPRAVRLVNEAEDSTSQSR